MAAVGDNFKGTLKTADDRLNLWVEQRTSFLKWIKPGKKQVVRRQPQVATRHPEADSTTPNEAALPESLAGFDLAAGLERLMGNERLYRKLLVDIGTNYTATAGEIRAALDAKDFKQVHSLIHNLKGPAGNLEAKDLENALERALSAVHALGPTSAMKSVESSEFARASVPPELIQKAAESIKAAAEMGDVAQIKSIAEELKSEFDAMAPFCNDLVQLAEDFDFDGIQKLIFGLAG